MNNKKRTDVPPILEAIHEEYFGKGHGKIYEGLDDATYFYNELCNRDVNMMMQLIDYYMIPQHERKEKLNEENKSSDQVPPKLNQDLDKISTLEAKIEILGKFMRFTISKNRWEAGHRLFRSSLRRYIYSDDLIAQEDKEALMEFIGEANE